MKTNSPFLYIIRRAIYRLVLACLVMVLASCGSDDAGPSFVPEPPIPLDTPDDFTFTDVVDAPLNTAVTSEIVTITGLEVTGTITIEGGLYALNQGNFTADSNLIPNNSVLQVQVTSSPQNSTATSATVTINNLTSVTFTVTTLPDRIPDAFSFTDQTDVALITAITSDSITVAGIEAAADISIQGGSYSVDGGTFTSASGTVDNGQTVTVQLTSSSSHSTQTDATLTIGGVSDIFSVTTIPDSIPNAFSFIDQTDITLETVVNSNTITISGIDVASPVSIVGGEYSIEGGAFASSDGSITNGQTIQVRQTSSVDYETQIDTVLTIGGVSDTFSTTTLEVPRFLNFHSSDNVVGQANFTSSGANQGGAAAANTVSGPAGNAGVLNDVLYVPDFGNNRLLGYNSIPAVDDQTADFVLGQTNFTNTGAGVSTTLFSGVRNVALSTSNMFLVGQTNNRVLQWNTIPTAGSIAADVVLGQLNFTSNNIGTCNNLDVAQPESVWTVDGKLIVADSQQNRVLIWNTIPTVNNEQADIVLGQQDFTHCAANDTDNNGITDGPSASTLNYPTGVWSDGTYLVVLDTGNNRALIWNTFPTSNFALADVVLGQGDFEHITRNDDNQDDVEDRLEMPTPGENSSARTLNAPRNGVYSLGKQLFIADTGNNRVLIWSVFPTTSFKEADLSIGQGDFIHNAANDDNQDNNPDAGPTARTLSGPTGVFQAATRLIITDTGNHRYLIYTSQQAP